MIQVVDHPNRKGFVCNAVYVAVFSPFSFSHRFNLFFLHLYVFLSEAAHGHMSLETCKIVD